MNISRAFTNLFTIGFTQKSAEVFFGLIKKYGVEVLVDVQLNNNQLAGFSKKDDLRYFLKCLCSCEYYHGLEFAPSKELLKGYQNKVISWSEYCDKYNFLIRSRDALNRFYELFKDRNNICLLCSEPTPENCHRRLLAEAIADKFNVKVIHI